MGEYARYRGQQIKIGTCESMYYLRADQAEKVQPLSGNVDPIGDAAGIRFRFPFPQEDTIEPGGFDDYDKALTVWGVPSVPNHEHYSVQFKADAGYLVSLPCPESELGHKFGETFTVHRNGFKGAVRIIQQRVWKGHLATVCECACGAAYRLEELTDAEPLLVGCRAAADEATREALRANLDPQGSPSVQFWNEIADRITAGYTNPPAWVVATAPVSA